MIDLIQNTIDGVMFGSAYALLALGFTLIFGTMRRLNLAYGPSIMAGVYLGTYASLRLGLGALPVALLVVAARRLRASTSSGCASARSARARPSPPWCRASPCGCRSRKRRRSRCLATSTPFRC